MNVILLMLTTVAVGAENHAGGHLAQVEVEDQDLLPRLHPRLLLENALSVGMAKNAVMELVQAVESLPRVHVSLVRDKGKEGNYMIFWLELHFRGDIYIVEIISRKK